MRSSKNKYNVEKLLKNVCIFLFSICFCSFEQQMDFAVIISPETAITEMTFNDLKIVLKGEKQRWKDNTKIMIAMMKSSSPTGNDISKKVYGMSGDAINKYWLALVFQGKATAPVFFESESELKAYVSKTKGAIGVISANAVGNEKSILIDGKKVF